jgi:hypothetical protein
MTTTLPDAVQIAVTVIRTHLKHPPTTSMLVKFDGFMNTSLVEEVYPTDLARALVDDTNQFAIVCAFLSAAILFAVIWTVIHNCAPVIYTSPGAAAAAASQKQSLVFNGEPADPTITAGSFGNARRNNGASSAQFAQLEFNIED